MRARNGEGKQGWYKGYKKEEVGLGTRGIGMKAMIVIIVFGDDPFL